VGLGFGELLSVCADFPPSNEFKFNFCKMSGWAKEANLREWRIERRSKQSLSGAASDRCAPALLLLLHTGGPLQKTTCGFIFA